MKKYMIPPHHFDESEAEQRNLTPKCGTPMVAGDLSALRFNKVQSFCHPYRHIPPLEMTMPAGSIQSIPGANYPKRCPASPVISTAAKRSGEISRLYGTRLRVAGDFSTLRFIRAQSLCHPYRRVSPLEMTMPAGSIQSFPEGQIGQNTALHRHFDRSEVEWRNLTPKCGKPMVAGDLSTLRFIRAQSLCHLYRRVPPLEMTVSAGSIQSFSGANYPKRCPASPVISTAAKRSGEISRRKAARPMVTGDLSALRFNKVQSFCHPYRQVPLEMKHGWRLTIRISHKKRAVKK